jgi:hypothetical protein
MNVSYIFIGCEKVAASLGTKNLLLLLLFPFSEFENKSSNVSPKPTFFDNFTNSYNYTILPFLNVDYIIVVSWSK